MRVGSLLIRSLLLAEFAVFLPGLPALAEIATLSPAASTYLLMLGCFAGLAAWGLSRGKSRGRTWAWAAALTSLPVFPVMTPVGVLLAALLFALDSEFESGAARRRPAGAAKAPLEFPSLGMAIVPLAAALCWAGTWSIHRYTDVAGIPALGPLSLFCWLWVLIPICAAIHQMGHRLSAENMGMETITDWSGWFDPQIASTERSGLRGRMFQAVMGGPLASVATGAFLLLAFLFSPGSLWQDAGEVAGLGAVVSLAIAALSLLPWRLAGHRSDGAVLLSLISGSAEANRDVCLTLLAGMWMNGSRPRDWDPRWLRAAASWPDMSQAHATGCALNYLHAMDNGYLASAQFWIARIAKEYAGHREAVPTRWQLEVSYYLARHDWSSGFADARAWKTAAGRGSSAPKFVTLRADAALAGAQGNVDEAAALAARAERAAHEYRRTGIIDFEFDLLGAFPRLESFLPSMPLGLRTAGRALT